MDASKLLLYKHHFSDFCSTTDLWRRYRSVSPGHVYAVCPKDENGIWKIGRAGYAVDRAVSIQNACPVPVLLRDFAWSANTAQAEKILHEYFGVYLAFMGVAERLWGECFRVEQEAVHVAFEWLRDLNSKYAEEARGKPRSPCWEEEYFSLPESKPLGRRPGIDVSRLSRAESGGPMDFLEVQD